MTVEAGRFGICPNHPGDVMKVTVLIEVEEDETVPVLIGRNRLKLKAFRIGSHVNLNTSRAGWPPPCRTHEMLNYWDYCCRFHRRVPRPPCGAGH